MRKIITLTIFLILNSSAIAADTNLPHSFQDITNNAENYSQYLDESDLYYKKD